MVVQIVSVVSAILVLRWDSWPLFGGLVFPLDHPVRLAKSFVHF